MTDPLNQFAEDAKHIRLSEASKTRIRENLISYVSANPVPAPLIPSPYERFLNIVSSYTYSSRHSFAFAACMLVLLVGTGTTFAATGSLPGDILYPVKVGVLEPARSLFAATPLEKAELEVKLTETRLQEVAALSAETDVATDAKTSSDVERLDKALLKAEGAIAKLKEHNPEAADQADYALTLVLEKHQEKLEQLGSTTPEKEKKIKPFVERVRAKVEARKAVKDAEKGEKELDKINVHTEVDATHTTELQAGNDEISPVTFSPSAAASTTVTVEASDPTHEPETETHEESSVKVTEEHSLIDRARQSFGF